MRPWYKVEWKEQSGSCRSPLCSPDPHHALLYSAPWPRRLNCVDDIHLLSSLGFQLGLANEDNRRTSAGRRTWESEVRFPAYEVTQGWLHDPVQRSDLQGALVHFFSAPRLWLSFVLFVPRTIPWPSSLGHGRGNNDALHSGCYTTPVVSLHCALWE